MKYEYDENIECFVRLDKKGWKLDITDKQADKICQLTMQGYSLNYIYITLELNIKKSTLKTFVNRFKSGDIIGYSPNDYKGLFNKIKRWFKWLN